MKELKTTEEIQELFKKQTSAENCRDGAIILRFATKTAIKFGVIANEFNYEAWNLVKALHPRDRFVGATYDCETKLITLKEDA